MQSTTRCVFCKVIPEWSLPLHSGSTLREVKGQVLLAQKASRMWFSSVPLLGMVYVRSNVTQLAASPFINNSRKSSP